MSTLLSQTVIDVELTVVALVYTQEVMHEELDLWMKFGDAQAWQR